MKPVVFILAALLLTTSAVHGLREYPTTQWVKDAKRWATVMRQTAETLRGKDTPDAWLFYLGVAVVRHDPALAQRLVKSIEAICPQDGTMRIRQRCYTESPETPRRKLNQPPKALSSLDFCRQLSRTIFMIPEKSTSPFPESVNFRYISSAKRPMAVSASKLSAAPWLNPISLTIMAAAKPGW